MKRLVDSRLTLPVIVLAAFAGWEYLSHSGRLSVIFFPAPSSIVQTASEMILNGRLVEHLLPTLFRLIVGFSIGGILGLLFGLAMGSSRRFRRLADPVVASAHPIPKVSLFPLFMVIFGVGEASKVFIVALAAFFPMLINTMTGVRQISPILHEVARNYGASRLRKFYRVVLPGSLPLVVAGVRLALNMALVLTIAVELVAADQGLGALVWSAWETFRVEELYVGIAVAAILGISFNRVLQYLQVRLIPWQVG